MKDFLGRDLGIGDFVIIVNPGYSDLCLGVVQKFTPQKVRIKYRYPTFKGSAEILKDPNSVVKINSNDEEFTIFLLTKMTS